MTFVSVAEAAKKAEQLLQIVKDAGGTLVPLEGLEEGVLALWQVLEALSNPGDLDDPVVARNYIVGAGMHDLAAKVVAAWNKDDASKEVLRQHVRCLGETVFTAQNMANLRWDKKDGVPREHGSADKVIELYWACLCILAGMKVDLDDPCHSSNGANPDVIASVNDTCGAFAMKTLSMADPVKAAKNLRSNVEGAIKQLKRVPCDKGFVVVNLKNVLDHADLQAKGPFAEMDDAQTAINEQIDALLNAYHLNEAVEIAPLFEEESAVVPIVILVAHTTVRVSLPYGKPMFAEIKTMRFHPLLTENPSDSNSLSPQVIEVLTCFNDLVQRVV